MSMAPTDDRKPSEQDERQALDQGLSDEERERRQRLVQDAFGRFIERHTVLLTELAK
jgi:hypothetical protein